MIQLPWFYLALYTVIAVICYSDVRFRELPKCLRALNAFARSMLYGTVLSGVVIIPFIILGIEEPVRDSEQVADYRNTLAGFYDGKHNYYLIRGDSETYFLHQDEEDTVLLVNIVPSNRVTTVCHGDGRPTVKTTETKQRYRFQWWVFCTGEWTETTYSYEFYIPEDGYIDLNYERWTTS